MKTPSFVKVNEKEQFEIQLSDKSMTNQSLHTNIEELEQFLRAKGTEKRTIHLDLTDNPDVTDVDLRSWRITDVAGAFPPVVRLM